MLGCHIAEKVFSVYEYEVKVLLHVKELGPKIVFLRNWRHDIKCYKQKCVKVNGIEKQSLFVEVTCDFARLF